MKKKKSHRPRKKASFWTRTTSIVVVSTATTPTMAVRTSICTNASRSTLDPNNANDGTIDKCFRTLIGAISTLICFMSRPPTIYRTRTWNRSLICPRVFYTSVPAFCPVFNSGTKNWPTMPGINPTTISFIDPSKCFICVCWGPSSPTFRPRKS